MSKLVLPNRAEPRPRWLLEFVGGVLRGVFTVGASGVLTVLVIAWMRAGGYLGG